jgi:hypothetical protein
MVAGRHGVEAEAAGAAEEAVELEVPVALDAGVGGPALGVGAGVGPTTSRSKSSVKLYTWCSMPSWSATRRASETSASEQHPESPAPPHSFIVAPTTSWP